jgi:RNA polymerase sigma factor (TIGR02999 family)
MEQAGRGEVTTLLAEYSRGNEAALDTLIQRVYPALHRLARRLMAGERVDHTLSATALVNEGFLRLFGNGGEAPNDSRHLLLSAAAAMQHVLTDHARRKAARKRNGRLAEPIQYPADELITIGELMGRLEATDARAAEVVRLRFYLGLTERETAAVLGISEALARQDWTWARAWLRTELHGAR